MTTICEYAWNEETEIVVLLPKDQARALLEACTIAQSEGPWAELAAAEETLERALA